MAQFNDLSPYTYSPESIPAGVVALAVGWLGGGIEFPTGGVPEDFRQALAAECAEHPRNRMRGWHQCPFEPVRDLTPVRQEIDGRALLLGSAEVRVVSREQKWLIAPDLVLHYVTQHRYLPPPEFVEAVTARRSVPKG